MGIQGLVRGQKKRTTFADPSNPIPSDLVQRDFQASSPKQLWMADFT